MQTTIHKLGMLTRTYIDVACLESVIPGDHLPSHSAGANQRLKILDAFGPHSHGAGHPQRPGAAGGFDLKPTWADLFLSVLLVSEKKYSWCSSPFFANHSILHAPSAVHKKPQRNLRCAQRCALSRRSRLVHGAARCQWLDGVSTTPRTSWLDVLSPAEQPAGCRCRHADPGDFSIGYKSHL